MFCDNTPLHTTLCIYKLVQTNKYADSAAWSVAGRHRAGPLPQYFKPWVGVISTQGGINSLKAKHTFRTGLELATLCMLGRRATN